MQSNQLDSVVGYNLVREWSVFQRLVIDPWDDTLCTTEFSAVKMRGQGGSYGELEATIGVDYCHTGHQGHQIIHPAM